MAREVLSCEAGSIDRAGEFILTRRFELDVLQARDYGGPAIRSLFGSLLDTGDLSLDLAVILDGRKMNHLDGLADVVDL